MDTSGILYPRYTDISQILLVRRKAECLATDLCKVPFDRLDEVFAATGQEGPGTGAAKEGKEERETEAASRG